MKTELRVRVGGMIFVFVLVSFIAGCSVATKRQIIGEYIDDSDVAKIEKGVTNRSDILGLFGVPDKMRANENGSDYLYEYAEQTSTRFNYVVPAGSGRSVKTLLVRFDKDGLVQDYVFEKS